MSVFLVQYRLALTREPRSKIVVIVPTVPLSKQHEGEFLAHGFGEQGWGVESYSSENSISRSTWMSVLEERSVMIMTAQLLLNLLDECVASISQIDLLVIGTFLIKSTEKKIVKCYCP